MKPNFTGYYELALSENTLPNHLQSATVRDWDQVPLVLRQDVRDLCAGQRKWPLFIHGPVGSGKSCAALCVADRVPLRKKDEVMFWAMPNFVNKVWDVIKGRADWWDMGRGGTLTVQQWWGSVTNLPLLVLDDVGLRETNTDDQTEPLFQALEARAGKPLICTSNFAAEEIEKIYGERIRSRMCSGTIYELRGRDRRYEFSDALEEAAMPDGDRRKASRGQTPADPNAEFKRLCNEHGGKRAKEIIAERRAAEQQTRTAASARKK